MKLTTQNLMTFLIKVGFGYICTFATMAELRSFSQLFVFFRYEIFIISGFLYFFYFSTRS